MKKLSIITINYNNAQGLERTIKSVACQYCKSDIEYIVVDGGSTDGSLEVIKKLEREIDYYISEPDKGIYNAMNKGIKFSHGEFCLFLNSGDCLLSSTSISQVFPLIPRNIDIFSFKNPNLKHSYPDTDTYNHQYSNLPHILLAFHKKAGHLIRELVRQKEHRNHQIADDHVLQPRIEIAPGIFVYHQHNGHRCNQLQE